ncbi:MAG: alpha/beta hydrolase [Actinomycetota bacterium]|nr:alpha/beta hydrolase [Actinomycetota bacterium]
MSRWRATASLAGALVGVAAAGAATTLAVRHRHRRTEVARAGEDVPLGSLRGDARTVVAEDGVPIHAEVDEPAADADPSAPTLVFVHGWTLSLDCWHYQRAGFGDTHRVVVYDHRSHGRSGASSPEHCTVARLGGDLAAVIEQVVPTGPIVLVGHSMGGMTVMSYAQQYPDLFRERVVAVALIGTSAGDLARLVPGRRTLLTRVSPTVGVLVGRVPRAVDVGRRLTGGFGYEATRRFAFGEHPSPAHVAFTDAMVTQSPASVFLDFWPLFTTLDMYDVVAAFEDVPTAIIVGTKDAVTPVRHSHRIAELLPGAELVVCVGAGHMVMLEQHGRVNEAIAAVMDAGTA